MIEIHQQEFGSKMLRHLTRFLALMLILGFACTVAPHSASAKDKTSKLSPHYREWLTRDVAYIITRQEKNEFLKLNTDEDREKFIETFWAIRNPDQGSPINTYREEHYKRLAYVDDHFGIGKRVPGWATARGQIYITLGEPKQTATYQGYDRVRPMLIWFYETNSAALPPFFYVVFYKQDSFGDYRTYSPYFDGPQELVTERGTTDQIAIQMIQRDVGQEVARISLSLLPDEPVDTNNPIRSLQSDVMMSVIHDLANSPANVHDLQRRAALMTVTSRILVGGETLGVLATPLRDSDGNTKVHYLLRLKKPEDFALGKNADGAYYFSIEARVQVYGPNDKLIFTQERTVKHLVSQDQVDQVKTKLFGYEGWLPLPPGTYHLKYLLTNLVNSVGYQAESNISIPEVPSNGLVATPLVAFSSVQSVQPELSGMIPFSVAGLKFSPLLPRELTLSPSMNLQLFYQIWAGRDELLKSDSLNLEARYAMGRPGAVGEARVVTDLVSKGQIDSTGTILTGKKIPLGDWPQGNYLLTLTLNSPDGRERASGTLVFHLMLDSPDTADWDVFDGEGISKDVRNGTMDYDRALCYLAFGEKESASQWFRNALDRNPAQEEARTALVNLQFGIDAFPVVAQLARQIPITADTEDETILRLAEALDKTGSTQDAINLLQSAIKLKTPTGPIYLTLASYYRHIGDARNGDDFEKKGQELMKTAGPLHPPTTKQ
ncbi:MAG: GWxTD domain-containing protein [Candidatus Acidiferrales bacterium]